MAKSAIINLSLQDKGVQQKLNQTGRRFKQFNSKLRADAKRTQAAQAKITQGLSALGSQAALLSPELAALSVGTQALSGAAKGLGGALGAVGVAAGVIAVSYTHLTLPTICSV